MTFLRWYAAVVMFAVTLNLRPGLITVGPVLPAIVSGLDLSPLAAGTFTALPILALGLASACAVPLGRVIGWSGGLVAAMLLDSAGIALRSHGKEWSLFCGATLLGVGIGLGNVYVPTLVKARFAGRIGLAMGLYTMTLTLGALIGAKLTPAIFAQLGDWRATLAVWAFPALIAAALATPLLAQNARPAAIVHGSSSLWGNGLAWAVTLYMGLQSALFYSIAQWIGALLASRGIALVAISADLQLFFVTQLVAALALPIVVARSRRQELIAAALPAIVGLAIAAALYGPPAAIPVCSAVLGLAIGGVFAVALTLQLLRAHSTENAARLSSMAQAAGYTIASVGPFLLGLLSKWPDPRLASTVWLLSLALVTTAAGLAAGRPRFVDGDGVGASGRLRPAERPGA